MRRWFAAGLAAWLVFLLGCDVESEKTVFFGDSIIALWATKAAGSMNPVNVAVGGSFSHQWMPGGVHFHRLAGEAPAEWCVSGNGSNDACWPFGCGAGGSGVSAEVHKSQMEAILSGAFSAGCANVVLALPTMGPEVREVHLPGYREAQRELCEADDRVVCADLSNVSGVVYPEDFPDGLHPGEHARERFAATVGAVVWLFELPPPRWRY